MCLLLLVGLGEFAVHVRQLQREAVEQLSVQNVQLWLLGNAEKELRDRHLSQAAIPTVEVRGPTVERNARSEATARLEDACKVHDPATHLEAKGYAPIFCWKFWAWPTRDPLADAENGQEERLGHVLQRVQDA
jgi:hypothetical protein